MCKLKEVLKTLKISSSILHTNFIGCYLLNSGPKSTVQRGLTTMDKALCKSFEDEVGITTFANSSSGFNGILKHRFSDFVVREVSINGEVSRLHDMSGNDLEEKWFPKDTTNLADPNEAADKIVTTIIALVADDANLSEDQINQLKSFIASCISRSPDCPLDFTGIIAKDKVGRSTVHGLFKGDMAKYIDSTTTQVNDKSVIRLIAKHKTKGSGVKIDKRAPQWPSGLPDYLQFTLFKENIDTMSAVNILCKGLHIPAGGVAYNGTKDKRGVTVQTCTVFRKKPSDFTKINSYPHTPVIRAGDFKYVKQEARLGALGGNRFEIVLRALDKPVEEIKTASAALEQSGFINYYGLQRFGKGGSKSHEVGKQIYKSNFKLCCDLMFTAHEFDKINLATAKVHYQSGEFQQAYDVLPDACYAEKAVLSVLRKHPEDYQSAYNSIMKNSRLICAHAYQSYIWNKVASRRIELFGLHCVVGDLVPLDSSVLNDNNDHDENVQAASDKGNSFQQSKGNSNIHIVTEEDVANNKFSIRDVILPIPGTDVILPTNESGKYYHELLAVDGLTMDSYGSCHVQYMMRGAYRRVIQMPQNFEWEVIQYKQFNDEIAITELTTMRAKNQIDVTEDEIGSNSSSDEKVDQQSYTALQLKFTLPPGTYATMLLRELTKESTESQFQAQLTMNSVHKRSIEESVEEISSSKVARID